MERITETPVNFGDLGKGHLYKTHYTSSYTTAIVAGYNGKIGKLSVNLSGCVKEADQLSDNEFFVKLYGEGEFINNPCFATGLFEVIGEPFNYNFGTYQKWRLKR